MDDDLTLLDAKLYYLDQLRAGVSRLKPERKALIDMDLAKGENSLVCAFLSLQAKLDAEKAEDDKEMMNDSVEVTLERLEDREKYESYSDPRRSFADVRMPLHEAVEIMKERLGIAPWSNSLGLDDSWRESLGRQDTDWRRSLDRQSGGDSWSDRDYDEDPDGRDRR